MGRTKRLLAASGATGLVLAASLTAVTSTSADADGVTVTDPSGATATTTLTFSSKKDLVTLTWPDAGEIPSDYSASVENPVGPSYTLPVYDYDCDGTTCTWTGKADDVASRDRATISYWDETFTNEIVVAQVDLLPADDVKPTISVKIKDRKVRAGQPIYLRTKFSDNQTEKGWDPTECSPGGDCYHPKWFPKMSLNEGKKWTSYSGWVFSEKPKKMRVWIKWPDEALNMSKIYKSPRLTWIKSR